MNIKDTFPSQPNKQLVKTQRSSNLELYRIVCMLMIVAHHYVVNSDVIKVGGPILSDPLSANSILLTVLGAWGKTGINCFLMITGYFMCTSKITLRKFVKLIGQIYFYNLIIFLIFLSAGYESLSLPRLIKLSLPFWGFQTNFVGCFIGFWLTIPFLNILVQNMNKRQHELLLVLLLSCFTILGSMPTFKIGMEYITWFAVIYFMSSYIRLYPNKIFEKKALWGWLTLFCVIISMISFVGLQVLLKQKGYFLVSDSNKILAVAVAICSFLWFKNMNIKYSKLINALGAGTFGVLLIHANSNAMRQWLWKDTFDVIGHYSLSFVDLIMYSFGVVVTIFIICNIIDQIRIVTVEKWFLLWYDSKMSAKADAWMEKITK